MLNEPGEAAYAKWNKKYGGLFTFFLGDEPVVMVTDAKKMHEMFVRDADTYSARTIYSQRYGEYMKLARGEWTRFPLRTLPFLQAASAA